jgi:hypothetical protein
MAVLAATAANTAETPMCAFVSSCPCLPKHVLPIKPYNQCYRPYVCPCLRELHTGTSRALLVGYNRLCRYCCLLTGAPLHNTQRNGLLLLITLPLLKLLPCC